jgi:hypothetical protein
MILHKGVHWWGRQDPHGARQLKKRKVINWVQPYKEVHCDTTQSYLPPIKRSYLNIRAKNDFYVA